jgi:hypothetical protein
MNRISKLLLQGATAAQLFWGYPNYESQRQQQEQWAHDQQFLYSQQQMLRQLQQEQRNWENLQRQMQAPPPLPMPMPYSSPKPTPWWR